MWSPETFAERRWVAPSVRHGTPAGLPSLDADALAWCAATALDVLGIPLAVVNAQAVLLHANRSGARHLLSSPLDPKRPSSGEPAPLHWVLDGQNQISLTHASHQKAWLKVLRQATDDQRCGLLMPTAAASGLPTRWRAASAQPPAVRPEPSESALARWPHALVLPLSVWGGRTPKSPGVRAEPLALVLLGSSGWPGDLAFQLLASHHKLTDAEARVLRHLCAGLTAQEIAQQNQVALSTITTQLASLRAKTGCRSVRDLTQWVGALVPIEPVGSSMRAC